MTNCASGINFTIALFDLTKQELIKVYRWSAINEDQETIKTKNNIVCLYDFTNNKSDENLFFDIQNLNLTEDQRSQIFIMSENNKIREMERRARGRELQKKYNDKIKEARKQEEKDKKTREPKPKKIYAICNICNCTTKNHAMHKKSKTHLMLYNIFNERGALTPDLTKPIRLTTEQNLNIKQNTNDNINDV
jgi:hypothetical protein